MSGKQSSGIFRLFLFLSLLALLAGCGGGSSGDDGDVPSFDNRMITAFSFTAEANPQLGADLMGTIDEANGTILLTGPLEADAVSGLKASFTTTGTQVSVGGIAQESGVTANSFAGPLTYRVTAEDGSTRDYTVHAAYWKHPSGLSDNISPDDQGTYSPQAAMDNNGNVLIVWSQFDGINYQIYKSEYRDGAWIHPANLSNYINPDGEDAYSPQVAMDDNGNALIVWRQFDGSNWQIYKSEYRDGAWTDPEELSENISPNGEDAYSPQVAMDDNGNALIVWMQSDGTRQQIYKSEYRDGAWIHPANLSNYINPDGEDANSPQVAMDDNGNALIVWTQSDGTRPQIYKSEYRDGIWTDPASADDNISPDEQSAYDPQVAMDNSGNALIVWRQFDGINWQIFKSEYRDGAWTDPTSADENISPNGQDVYYPQVAMDGGGNALIVWEQSDGSNYQVFKSEYRDGAWTHPEDLDDHISQNGQDAEDPQAAMDDSGNAVIVWEQSDGINWQIFKREYRDGAWTGPEDLSENISPDGQDAYPSQVAMDDSGNAVIVWNQSDGSTWQIFKSEYRFWEE